MDPESLDWTMGVIIGVISWLSAAIQFTFDNEIALLFGSSFIAAGTLSFYAAYMSGGD